ncbi:TetR/AcrR family transcriptional regulator [Thermocrinis minervae]|uniref:Transcriptional regulator, TetR family n=1 Tax=Thermocrinis minervae TaxID=381751 RepID=A0A1M6SMD3_9AQUI|nr:TetR/AcrR family transcriptional regulator [Thermocrinis minervae]SHK45911.1 transcriptional regulator, TetR family [Thermocrinis minervae]
MLRFKNTKERILESALKLFSEKGIRETTLKDIARDVGITEGAIYRHFSSKDEIVDLLFKKCAEDFYTRLKKAAEKGNNCKEKVYLLGQEFLNFCFENPEAFKYMDLFHYLRAEKVSQFKPLPKDAVVEVLEFCKREGVLKVPVWHALALLVGTLERVFLLSQAGILNKEGAYRIMDIIWKALT